MLRLGGLLQKANRPLQAFGAGPHPTELGRNGQTSGVFYFGILTARLQCGGPVQELLQSLRGSGNLFADCPGLRTSGLPPFLRAHPGPCTPKA